MSQSPAPTERPDYGIDAPKDLRRNTLYGAGGIAMGIILFLLSEGGALGIFFAVISFISGIVLLINVAVAYRGSKVGKLRLRDKVLGTMAWRGDERVLDIGCGNGLLVIGAAKHLTTGRAIGIDMWQDYSGPGNGTATALHNAELEGVSNRVDVRPGDARDLPYDNNDFDVVLSSWVIHEMLDPDERVRVLKEIARVLKPGGRAVIIDTDFANEYVRFFKDREWQDVEKSKPEYLFFTPSYVVRATKPLR